MKFVIVSKGDDRSNKLKATMKQYLTDFDLEYDKKEPELVISIGGDGTFLEAFHRYIHRLSETSFIGIHTGHLGFYADWVPEEVEKLIIEIAKTPFQIVEYPLLEVTIRSKTGESKDTFLALNEATIKTADGSVVFDVEIKGERFETFRGDGLCISTPSGSTAYNKALGGAIIHPSLDAIQLTEMASINNRVFRTIGSPLILPKHHPCILRPTVDRSFLIAIDHFTTNYTNVESIQCRVAEERIRFARFRQFPFWNRVRDSFVAEENS
ncbi:inorganic polyphosphate/ATP-NAD kinase [Oceanobacillus picturae]|uniref:NAD kinase n=1 Tax=Oceanobacillus picturae TaxID=171693 RepID=W9AJ20_9BACI|nr:NAD kinase [Oceanobacillus picturae]RIU89321.1 NAD kinase [Oceanobacillus picturae]GAQ16344.1 inorganic polyphosphate/ATP-NAD kinase [Oceanobacillus picturae]CDO02646.1 putative inorganic polyphosphate/ATP-NAD kinase [Oceanobacillus picturae]